MRHHVRLWWIVAVCAVLLLGATCFYKGVHFYTMEYDVPATCTVEGGHYRQCALCKKVVCDVTTPPTGHKQEWYTVKEPTSATEGIEELRCSVCNILLETKRIPMKESPIPSLYLHGSGMGMSATNSISADFVYRNNGAAEENPDLDSHGTTKVRLMDAGADYDKKLSYVLNNFTVDEGETPLFGDFGQSDEIRIYANNDDMTCVRRIVSYSQWRDIVAANYPEYSRFISASEDTEYAGYNFLLYIRNQKPTYTFMGIYTLSVPYTVLAQKNAEAGVRYVLHDYYGKQEYVFGEKDEEQAARESLERLMQAGTENLSFYTDLKLLIDYYAFSQMIGNGDAFTDLYWVSPDGIRWYPVPNDTEHTYGSRSGTVELCESDAVLSKGPFWHSFAENHSVEIRRRITALKRGRLSPENVRQEFENAISKLDVDVYREDCRLNNVPFRNPDKEVDKLIEWYRKRLSVNLF